MPYACFYNGLSLLKRLPTLDEISDKNKAIDLESGFKMKDSFMEMKNSSNFTCQKDLQSLYEDNIEGRQLDGLLPFQEKYLGNSYIDVFGYFCRGNAAKDVAQMYATGLELQQKLDKIIDYDKCSPDQAKQMGLKPYCNSLFKDTQFFFWGASDLSSSCDEIDTVMSLSQQKDECAVLNDHIFGKYHQKQQRVFLQVQEISKQFVKQKTEKM